MVLMVAYTKEEASALLLVSKAAGRQGVATRLNQITEYKTSRGPVDMATLGDAYVQQLNVG